MSSTVRCVLALILCVAGAARAHAADDGLLFRVFLTDGSSLVTYGEFARVGDQVVLSVPVGGTQKDPRLQAVSLTASRVDWDKTERHAASTRYQRYVATRAEADYQLLTEAVAAVLNNIAQSTDRASALAAAERARQMLNEWPRSHYGYRQQDVQEIVSLLNSAISRLQGGSPTAPFQIALVSAPAMSLDPLATMPSPREQLEQLLRIARITTDVRDRVALLRSALNLVATPGVAGTDSSRLRRTIEDQLKRESAIDLRYDRLSRDMLARASRAATDAKIRDVERILERIPKEDARLGSLSSIRRESCACSGINGRAAWYSSVSTNAPLVSRWFSSRKPASRWRQSRSWKARRRTASSHSIASCAVEPAVSTASWFPNTCATRTNLSSGPGGLPKLPLPHACALSRRARLPRRGRPHPPQRER